MSDKPSSSSTKRFFPKFLFRRRSTYTNGGHDNSDNTVQDSTSIPLADSDKIDNSVNLDPESSQSPKTTDRHPLGLHLSPDIGLSGQESSDKISAPDRPRDHVTFADTCITDFETNLHSTATQVEDVSLPDSETGKMSEATEAALQISSDESTHFDGLWNTAYDRLQSKNPEIITQYESIVSSSFSTRDEVTVHSTSRRPSTTEILGSRLSQKNTYARKAHMSEALDIWLMSNGDSTIEQDDVADGDADPDSRTQSSSEDRASVFGGNHCSLGEILRRTVQRNRNVPLIWLAYCLSVERLFREESKEEISDPRIVTFVLKMEWYINLARIIITEGHRDKDHIQNKPDLLEPLLDLYEAILSFHLHAACLPQYKSNDLSPLPELPRSTYLNILVDAVDMREDTLATFSGIELRTKITQAPLRRSEDASSASGSEQSIEDVILDVQRLLDKLNVPAQVPPRPHDDEEASALRLHKWLFDKPEVHQFITWSPENDHRILWLGGPCGSGKTRLLQTVVQSLVETASLADGPIADSGGFGTIAYFFANDRSTENMSSLSAIKSLISHVLLSQPGLRHHLDDCFDDTDREEFNHSNDFYALATVLYAIVDDDRLLPTMFVIDGIQNFATFQNGDAAGSAKIRAGAGVRSPRDNRSLNDVMNLVSTTARLSNKVKWLISLDSEKRDLRPFLHVNEDIQLEVSIGPDLEIVLDIARTYIESKVSELAIASKYKGNLQNTVTDKLQQAFAGDFLWLKIALVTLKKSHTPWNAPNILCELEAKMPDIHSLYDEVRSTIQKHRDTDTSYCEDILSIVAVAYRPLSESEVIKFTNLPPEVDLRMLIESMLPEFLELCPDQKVRFLDPSAGSFIKKGMSELSLLQSHSRMADMCIDALRGDIREQLDHKEAGSLGTAASYGATFWARHLSEGGDIKQSVVDQVNELLTDHLITWMAMLNSREALSQALVGVSKLHNAFISKTQRSDLRDPQETLRFIRDVRNYIQVHHVLKHSSHHDELEKVDNRLEPQTNLLFYTTGTSLRQKLLPKHFRELIVPPIVEPFGVLCGCVKVMRHPDWVRSCSFSHDERLVVSGSDDMNVRIWDCETGNLQLVLDGFSTYVYAVAVSRTSVTEEAPLVAASDYSTIKIWDLHTGRLIRSLSTATEVDEKVYTPSETTDSSSELMDIPPIRSIAITQKGDKLAAAIGGRVVLWNLSDFTTTWLPHDSGSDVPVREVCFSPDGRLLACAEVDITIWDVDLLTMVRKLPNRESSSWGVSEDETHNGTGSQESQSECSMPGGQQIGHTGIVDCLDFSPDSRFIASGSDDTTARIWDAVTRNMLAVLEYHQRGVNSVSFSADGTRLATGSSDKEIAIWIQKRPGEWGTGEKLTQPDHILRGHTSMVWSVSFAPSSNMLLSAANDDELRLWDTDMAEQLAAEADTADTPLQHPSNPHIGGGSGHLDRVHCVALSPDGARIASASMTGTICLWDGRTGIRQRTLSTTDQRLVTSLVFSQDGKLLISTSTSSNAHVWEVASDFVSEPRNYLVGHDDWVRDAAISPDGRFVATASDDRTVRLWDISEPDAPNKELGSTCFKHFRGHTDYVYCVAFSHDGKVLATAGDDFHVHIRDIPGGSEEVPEKDMTDRKASSYVRGLAFSANDSKLLSVCEGGTVAIWNANLQEEEQCILVLGGEMTFRSIRIDLQFPNVLLTEFGDWGFDVGDSALDEAAAAFKARPASASSMSSTASLPLRQLQSNMPDWRISEISDWITFGNDERIFIPREFRCGGTGVSCRVQGDSVVVGCRSGQVLLFRFSDSPASGNASA